MTARSFGRLLAAAMAVALLAGLWFAGPALGAAGHGGSDGPPSCGNLCFNLFNERYAPGLVQASVGGHADAGNGIGLRRASNNIRAEDFAAGEVGLVTVMCNNWPAPGSLRPNSYACLNDATPADVYAVFESKYSPYRKPTDLCAGLKSAATPGEAVTLQTCGSPATEWIPQTSNFAAYFLGGQLAPWINAADLPSTRPEVLTATGNEHHEFAVDPEGKSDTQEWGIIPGLLF
jgi:hypothetical protein